VFAPGRVPLNDFSFRKDKLAPMLQQKHIPNEEDLYMMPPHVHAFVIQDKKWGKLVQLYTSDMIVTKLNSCFPC
jgi:hypothetical protein